MFAWPPTSASQCYGDDAFRLILRTANCFASHASTISQPGCDKTTRRANHSKTCPALPRKIFRFRRRANQFFSFAVSPDERGGSRSSRTRGGMQWTRKLAQDEREPTRTAKPCGPDAPTLASSSWETSFSGATVARKPGHRGEHEISRKPLRRESRIASAGPVCSCAFFCTFVHTRPRVQRASGFPCALFFSEGGHRRKARAHRAARSGICVCDESGYCEERSVRVDFRYTNQSGQRVLATPSYPIKPTLPNRGTEFCI